MEKHDKQVFYTPSRRRWRVFRGVLLVGMLGLLTVVGLIFWSIDERVFPKMPRLQDNETTFRKLAIVDSSQTDGAGSLGVPTNFRRHLPARHAPAKRAAIRAGFYVNWDAQSYQTLRDHIGQINMVMPEWLFVGNKAELQTDIDAQADSLLKAHPGVAVVPMISNFYQGNWRGKNVHRLLNHPARRRAFIAQVVAQLDKHHFQGVNIDFEELNEETNETLTDFVREMHAALHPKGYLVTIDTAPLNEDYDLPELREYVDYIVLMAYDQHFSTSAPGPVAPYQWIEYVLEETCKQIPSEQVILGVAGYGYDWPAKGEGVDITYQQAMARANRKSATPVRFDNQTYNLSFRYQDDAGKPHTVWFNDAASAYNVLRATEDYETAGAAIWRLGSEDVRTWDYYARNVSMPALTQKPMNWQQLQQVPALPSVDYQGEGDILDVDATPHAGRLKLEYDTTDQLISEERYLTLPTSYVVRKVGKADKTMVLSFDDGPDETYTPQILDILEREHVPASFFVIGLNAQRNLPLLQRMARSGYEIGNHTTLHPDLTTVSPRRLFFELNTCRRLIESITGRSTILFRPPYNADSEPNSASELRPIALAEQQHYYTIGESIDPLDWQAGVTPEQILTRIRQQENLGNIILLHDAGGDRSATVKALPAIIHYYKQHGYRFATLSQLMNRPDSELMPAAPVQQATLVTDRTLVQLIYYGQRTLTWLFLIGILLAMTRVLLLAGLALWQKKRQRPIQNPYTDLVSIIVPAYNEELNAVRTIESLLASTYANLEVVFVDDGSKDKTYDVVKRRFADDSRVQVLTKPNGGKASALNLGVGRANGAVVVCIDADTQLLPDAVGRLVAGFTDPAIGAVAGNVQVGNQRNALTRFQAIEYTTSQNFDRRAYAVLNCITVVPGAIGAFRRSAVLAVGGFTTDTLAEDCDLTIRLLRNGYRVDTCNEAIAVTEAPETLPMLIKQRVRWCYGVMQTVWKHRDLLFRRGRAGGANTAVGWLALPSLLLFQFGFPLLTLVAELQLALSFVTGTWGVVLTYFLAFLGVDAVVAMLAYRLEGRSLRSLWWLLPQRMAWRYLLFWVLIRSYLNALRGEVASWGVLKRTGQVVLTPAPALTPDLIAMPVQPPTQSE
ncbi:glycosyltransferase [Spirosoma rhododendri]|uniref:Glycosyltransferase n=1 Tax=Spirosoma rhododendri TaxID=2728024 RepID=A0A7L5DUG8_9BACT|nr:glycosyltransferase [Spirosoma rhododendri]QJD80973.1 glycosyltransferase [Spirosoma rhododendri]